MPNFSLSIKALRELGVRPAINILRYRIGLKSGWYRLRTHPGAILNSSPPVPLGFLSGAATTQSPDENTLARVEALLQGAVELFGGLQRPLDFSVPVPLTHWTEHESAQISGQDVKFVWEPARFSWVSDLVRVYRATADPRLPAFFEECVRAFMAGNPAYAGPHWANGQEVGLRLMNLALAHSVFQGQFPGLGEILALHAARIPPTLIYARAQRNNHLLSEAAALFTAGLVLPDDPRSAKWCRLGRQWFRRGVLDQFSPDGVYMQQSVNYHRLALQLALWMNAAAHCSGKTLPDDCIGRLAAGTRHLLSYCDPETGAVPNLGANDGAYIFPLTNQPYGDYRPVLQAAARAFLGGPAFPPGSWDDMSAWFNLATGNRNLIELPTEEGAFLPHPALPSRASLRAAVFTHRPGHADQLHVDVWWRGLNIAADPGTYQYNADPPWDNALVSAFFHNTLTIDGRDQMLRAGRFLFVDRATARTLDQTAGQMTAEHDGYRNLGVVHRRTLAASPAGWLVQDTIDGRTGPAHMVRLHWLLPDLPWRLDGSALSLDTVHGRVRLAVMLPEVEGFTVRLARAGENLVGPSVSPAAGWFSPTYGVKIPALSFSVEFRSMLPLRLESAWEFPKDP